MSFYEWLLSRHRDRDTPLGELARLVEADPAFPRGFDDRDPHGIIIRHLRSIHASDDVLTLFARAWNDFASAWLRCPVCLVAYARGLGGREAGDRCGNVGNGQERPCVGRLMPQEDLEAAEWVYPREYGAPDPRRRIRLD